MGSERMTVKIISYEEWLAKGKSLFGDDMKKWRWICPACGNIQSAEMCLANNPKIHLSEVRGWINFSCEGRVTAGVGCYWTLGGLLQIHELEVMRDGIKHPTFLFDGEESSIKPSYTPRQSSTIIENRPYDRSKR